MLVKQIAKQGPMLKNFGAMYRAGYHGSGAKVTMNDMPIPRGDWKENYSRQNAKYNAILIAGIVVFASTIGLAKSSGVIELNCSPPSSLD